MSERFSVFCRAPWVNCRCVADELHAVAHLHGHGNDGVLGRGGAGDADGLVDEVLEIGAHLLEAGGVHVGQVVRDRVDVGLLAYHAAGGGPQASYHAYPYTFTTSLISLPSDRVLGLYGLLVGLVGAVDLDHAHHLGHRVHVGGFHETLHHLRPRPGLKSPRRRRIPRSWHQRLEPCLAR